MIIGHDGGQVIEEGPGRIGIGTIRNNLYPGLSQMNEIIAKTGREK